jgi:hypothetical protein
MEQLRADAHRLGVILTSRNAPRVSYAPGGLLMGARRPPHGVAISMTTAPVDGPSPERSAPVGSPQPVCVVCGEPRDPRKRENRIQVQAGIK